MKMPLRPVCTCEFKQWPESNLDIKMKHFFLNDCKCISNEIYLLTMVSYLHICSRTYIIPWNDIGSLNYKIHLHLNFRNLKWVMGDPGTGWGMRVDAKERGFPPTLAKFNIGPMKLHGKKLVKNCSCQYPCSPLREPLATLFWECT